MYLSPGLVCMPIPCGDPARCCCNVAGIRCLGEPFLNRRRGLARCVHSTERQKRPKFLDI